MLNEGASSKDRFKYVTLAHRLRVPLAILAIAVAWTAALSEYLSPVGETKLVALFSKAVTITLIMGIVIHLRPLSRMTVASRAVLAVLSVILACVVVIQALEQLSASSRLTSGFAELGVGTDPAALLLFLTLACLLSDRSSKIAMALAITAGVLTTAALMGRSYQISVFEQQMSFATLASLLLASFSILTIMSHQPYLRMIVLAGTVAARTRVMILVGTLVPWAGGFVLYRFVGVQPRDIPVEALIIGITILSICAVAIVSGQFHERADHQRRSLERELERMATRDRLTNTLNRAGIARELELRWHRFQKFGETQCAILIDLDHFKQINDRHGHDEGDRVLSMVGTLVRPLLRQEDAIGRWGGEEFLVLLSGIDANDATVLAERLRCAIENMTEVLAKLRPEGAAKYSVTGSFGVAFYEHEDLGHAEAVTRADLALYMAKRNGRNRVCFDPALSAQVA